MRRSFSGLVVGLMLALTACGGSGDSPTTQGATGSRPTTKAPAGLVKPGEFSACVDASFPPMESLQGGKPVGFDVDLVKAVADQWGVQPSFRETQFDGLLPAVSSGRCDVVWSGIFVTPERTKTFPAVPYMKSGMVLLVEDGNPDGITSPEALAGKTVSTQAGTEYPKRLEALAAKLRAAGKAAPTVQSYPKMSDAVQQLIVGRADAVLTQDTEAAYRQSSMPGRFTVGYRYPSTDIFGVYHKKSAPELGSALRQALSSLKADGRLGALAKKYGLPEDSIAVGG